MSNSAQATVITDYGVVFERTGFPGRMLSSVESPDKAKAQLQMPPKTYAFFFVQRKGILATIDGEVIRGYGEFSRCSPTYYLGRLLDENETERYKPFFSPEAELPNESSELRVIRVTPEKFVFPKPTDVILGQT